MSLLSSPASRTSPRLVASQSMAYLFIEGNEAKFCDRADTSVSPGAEKTLATPIVVSLVLFGVPSFFVDGRASAGLERLAMDW